MSAPDRMIARGRNGHYEEKEGRARDRDGEFGERERIEKRRINLVDSPRICLFKSLRPFWPPNELAYQISCSFNYLFLWSLCYPRTY